MSSRVRGHIMPGARAVLLEEAYGAGHDQELLPMSQAQPTPFAEVTQWVGGGSYVSIRL